MILTIFNYVGTKSKREAKTMKKCPSCSTDNSDDTKFCKNCGIQLSVSDIQNTPVDYPKVRCPICGTLNITTRKFCSSCGQPLTQEAADQMSRQKNPPSAKKPNGCLKAFLITALVCVVLFVILPIFITSISSYLEKANAAAAQVSSHNAAISAKTSNATNQISNGSSEGIAPSETTKTPTTAITEAPIAKIGDKIDVGDISYVVEKVEISETVGGEYINQTAKGTYLLVTISITNNSNDPITISDSFFTVLNGDKKFSADSMATIYADSESSLWLDELNPELTITGIIAFDVSAAVADSQETQLQVQTGFWGTQTGIISLAR